MLLAKTFATNAYRWLTHPHLLEKRKKHRLLARAAL